MTHPLVMPIPNDIIDEWWPKILPWAEDFCNSSQGSYDPLYILQNIKQGKMQTWLVIKDDDIVAICLTEIRKTLLKECIIIVMTGEEMISWIHLLKSLEKYAILMGCKKMVGIARPGWEKILKSYGYRKTHVQLEREL